MYMLQKALRVIAVRGTLPRRRVGSARPCPRATGPVNTDMREFSISTLRNAEEDNTRVLEALAKSPEFRKVLETPAIVEAMTSLVLVAQEEGMFIHHITWGWSDSKEKLLSELALIRY